MYKCKVIDTYLLIYMNNLMKMLPFLYENIQINVIKLSKSILFSANER